MIETEMLETSYARQSSIETKLMKLKRQYGIQKKDYKKQREEYTAKLDNSTLFEKVDALDNPLLGGDGDKQDERRRMDQMNNKLVDANFMGYEAEMRGNNIRNELLRNDEQFMAVEFNVSDPYLTHSLEQSNQ